MAEGTVDSSLNSNEIDLLDKKESSVSETEQLKATIAKYKKLLNLARQGLEENQRQLTEKDNLISHLQQEAEVLRNRVSKATSRFGETEYIPKRILRRVDIGGGIWALFEWSPATDTDNWAPEPSWRQFYGEEELKQYISTDCGEPISIPESCMNSSEARKVREDAQELVNKIQEEFRRFKIKAEIAQKQKEAETKQALGSSVDEKSRRIMGLDLDGELRRGQAAQAQVAQLRQELAQQELMWRKAYDTLTKENDRLKTGSGESTIAAQWRQRYEAVMKEKEELIHKVEAWGGDGNGSASGSYLLLESKYRCLKEEYKEYRKRAKEAMKAGGSNDCGQGNSLENAHNQVAIPGSFESKIQYLKSLMLQYLCTAEQQQKEYMERAIFTVLRFTDDDKRQVQEKRNGGGNGLWMTKLLG